MVERIRLIWRLINNRKKGNSVIMYTGIYIIHTYCVNSTMLSREFHGFSSYRQFNFSFNSLLKLTKGISKHRITGPFVRGNHRLAVDSPHEGTISGWRFHIMTSSHMITSVNSLRPSYMSRQQRPSLVQLMACSLFGTRPLSEPMMQYCQLDP